MKMSIRTKLLLFVLCAFLANILFVYGYYNLFLSSQITSFNTSMHEELQAETNRIAKEIDNREDFADVLHEIAAQNDFLIEVSDEDGATVLHAGKETEVHVKNSAGCFTLAICI